MFTFRFLTFFRRYIDNLWSSIDEPWQWIKNSRFFYFFFGSTLTPSFFRISCKQTCLCWHYGLSESADLLMPSQRFHLFCLNFEKGVKKVFKFCDGTFFCSHFWISAKTIVRFPMSSAILISGVETVSYKHLSPVWKRLRTFDVSSRKSILFCQIQCSSLQHHVYTMKKTIRLKFEGFFRLLKVR